MCLSCDIYPYEFGEVLPGWWLKRARVAAEYIAVGDWCMVQSNSPTFVFSHMPIIDDDDAPDDHFNAVLAAGELMDTAIMSQCYPIQCYQLICAAMSAENGYSTHYGNFSIWLNDHIARYISHIKSSAFMPTFTGDGADYDPFKEFTK